MRPEEVQETPKVDSRQVMFKEVKELQAEGLNIAQISKKLDIARQTVRKYMGYDTLPKRASKERLPYYLYDTYVEEEYRHGKDLRKIFMKSRKKAFRVPRLLSTTTIVTCLTVIMDTVPDKRSR